MAACRAHPRLPRIGSIARKTNAVAGLEKDFREISEAHHRPAGTHARRYDIHGCRIRRALGEIADKSISEPPSGHETAAAGRGIDGYGTRVQTRVTVNVASRAR